MFCFCSSFSVYVEAELPIGMSMWIYLPMRINMDIRIIRHMSDIARYMRRIFRRGILSASAWPSLVDKQCFVWIWTSWSMREYEIGEERKDKTKVSFIAQGVAEANYIAGEHYNRTAGSGAPQVSARLPDTQPECQSNNSSFSQAPQHLSHYPPQSHWLQEPENNHPL